MPIYHKKYRNTGLNACGCHFQIGPDGLLTPDPDEETKVFLLGCANYEERGGAEEPKVEEPKVEEPVSEEPKDSPAPEKEEEKEKATAAPKRRTSRKKRTSKKSQ